VDTIKIGKKEIDKGFFIFLAISVLLGMVSAVDSTSLANRLYEDLDFTVMQRALLESPRELPGLLSVFFIGLLNGLGDVRIAAVANILGGIGLILFGMAPNHSHFVIFLTFLVIYSTGQHIYIPLSNTIAMTFAKGENFGQRLGQVQGLGSFSIIVSSGVLFVLYEFFHAPYSLIFTMGGVAMMGGGALFLLLGSHSEKIVSEKRFVFRKEYKMYYVLAVINGARKQITLTFAPWLLITVFGRPVTTITALFFVVCVINIFFKPWFGGMIDKKGEKFALRFEAAVMFVACVGFSFSKSVFGLEIATGIVSFCYIIDKLMESAVMARATYVRRISKDPADVARTLTMGQSMDHVISVMIPVFAGYAWYTGGADGYIYVFSGGIAISILNFIVVGKLKY